MLRSHFYELEHESLPTTIDYSIILNSNDEPVAIIKTIEVTVTPMNEVSEEFAIAEGEGDVLIITERHPCSFLQRN